MRTRRIGILAIALLVASVIQTTLGSKLTIFTARPDLVLLLVVTYSVSRGGEEGLIGGLLGGLLIDIHSAIPFGTATIGMGLVGLATGLGEANVYRANLIIPLVAVFLATVFYQSILMLTLQAAGWSVEWISTLALQTIPGAVLNALLAPVAFALIKKLSPSTEGEDQIRW